MAPEAALCCRQQLSSVSSAPTSYAIERMPADSATRGHAGPRAGEIEIPYEPMAAQEPV